MTAHKPGLSAVQLQHMLGLGRYETAWLILHKLRRAMVDANRELLTGTVEVDETFIGCEQLGLRGGRQLGGRKALMVVVAVEVRGSGSGRCRAEVLPDAAAPTLSRFIARNIEQGSTVLSAGHLGDQGKDGVATQGYTHLPRTQESFRLAGTEDVVPHAHRATSNLKAWLLGTHRGVGADQLPVYLDEFVFCWNRRRSPMAGFLTLLGLGTHRGRPTRRSWGGPPPRVALGREAARRDSRARQKRESARPFENAEGHCLHDAGDILPEWEAVEPDALAARREDLDADHGAIRRVVDAPRVIESHLVIPGLLGDRQVCGIHRLVVFEQQVLLHVLRPLRHTVTTRPS